MVKAFVIITIVIVIISISSSSSSHHPRRGREGGGSKVRGRALSARPQRLTAGAAGLAERRGGRTDNRAGLAGITARKWCAVVRGEQKPFFRGNFDADARHLVIVLAFRSLSDAHTATSAPSELWIVVNPDSWRSNNEIIAPERTRSGTTPTSHSSFLDT